MEITEIRINLVGGPAERVKAFCTITLDGGFVVRDLKIIEGPSGLFLAMPSRKLADRCPKCAAKNHLRARFCNQCGARLNEARAPRDEQGRIKLHADVAHPINAECRDTIQAAVIEAFHAEVEKSGRPGYEPANDADQEFAGPEFDEFIEASRESKGLAYSEPSDRPSPALRSPPDHSAPQRQPADRATVAADRSDAGSLARTARPSTAGPFVEDDDGFGAGIL